MNDVQPHFDDRIWIDFVRGLPPADGGERLRAHLETGCRQCLETHTSWKRIAEVARREASYEVPETTVRLVKAAFGLRRKAPMLSKLATMAVRTFDSFLEPLPSGMRGGATPARQLLHEAGNFLIDLRLETTHASEFLTGQILCAGTEGGASGAGVVLVQGNGNLVAQTIANSLGEFHVEFERQDGLQLYLETGTREIIAIALPDAGNLPGARLNRASGENTV
jgi:hypothetical protein